MPQGNPLSNQRLNRQESAEAVVAGALECVSCEGLNIRQGYRDMGSYGTQRQQKIPSGSHPGERAVNPQDTPEAPSVPSAPLSRNPCEAHAGLMAKVVKRSNILTALDRVEKNQGAPGIDGMRTSHLRAYLNERNMENWKRIKAQLLEGTYTPRPLLRKVIPKPGGGERQLGIPTVLDRLIQQAILQVLTPLFDPGFSRSSFGFRPGRKAHQAVKQAQGFIHKGYRIVVDMDLEKFFDRVHHDLLMARIARKVKDKAVLRAVRAFLTAGVMVNGCCVATEEGTPQGGPLSPLLANIMLDDLDKELEKRGHCFCRYADDCNIYVKSRRAGERVMESVRHLLEHRLKLKVNEAKSAVDHPWYRKFLGFSFTSEETPRIRLSEKAVRKFKDRIRDLTRRSRGVSMSERLQHLNRYLMGWLGYFRLIDTVSVLENLDSWIRHRLRACLLKQWKRPRTIHRNLVSLGIPPRSAYETSGSRKGWWRLSRTPQMHKALGIAFWAAQGLHTLVGSYQKLRLAL